MKKKLALVLSGGGFKGAFQLGALEYLMNHPVHMEDETIRLSHFDIISGVSVGSLNGAFIATHQLDALRKIWFEDIVQKGAEVIYTSKFLDNGRPSIKRILKELVPDLPIRERLQLITSRKKQFEFTNLVLDNLMSLGALADNGPLFELLEKYIHLDKFRDMKYKMGFVSLRDGRYKSLCQTQLPDDRELQKTILASTTIPVIWPPVSSIRTREGEEFFDNVDGGLRNLSPLKDVIDEINAHSDDDEEYYIIVINSIARKLQPIDPDPTILDVAVRSMLDITLDQIFKSDIENFLWINNMLRAQGLQKLELANRTYRRYKIKIIQPPYSIGDTLDSRPETILRWRQLGFETAQLGNSAMDWNF